MIFERNLAGTHTCIMNSWAPQLAYTHTHPYTHTDIRSYTLTLTLRLLMPIVGDQVGRGNGYPQPLGVLQNHHFRVMRSEGVGQLGLGQPYVGRVARRLHDQIGLGVAREPVDDEDGQATKPRRILTVDFSFRRTQNNKLAIFIS